MARIDEKILNENERLSSKQVAEILGLGKNTVKEWRDKGKLKDWVCIDGVFGYSKEEVQKIKTQRFKR